MDLLNATHLQAPSGLPTQKWTTEQVLAIHTWTPTLCSFRISRPRSFRFRAGHYARLGLQAANGTLVWRPYSIVSAVTDEYLEFLAVLVPEGEFSLCLADLRLGDAVQLEKLSFGFLTLDQLASGEDLWLIASGSGLGPFISILREASVWQDFQRIFVIHSVRRAAELAYREDIQRIAQEHKSLSEAALADLCYLPIVTREAQATTLSGRIPLLLETGQLEQAAGRVLQAATSRIMVCGNPDMSRDLRQLFISRGFATTRRGVLGQMAFEKYW